MPEVVGGIVGATGLERCAAAFERALEAVEVELVLADDDAVAAARGLDPLAAEHAAQAVHVDLQRLEGRRWRSFSPEPVDELVGRHNASAVDEEQREQPALLRRAERSRSAVELGLDRPQDAELQRNPPLPLTPAQVDLKRLLRGCQRQPRRRHTEKEASMIRAGDAIENPVTGERIVFRQTSRETNGAAVVIETYVQPNGSVAAAHVHPSQEERFEVLRGTVGFRVGREKLVAGPGKRLTVPAGTPHKFWNAGDEVAHFVCEIRPALQFESLIETMFSLAADGRTNRKGMPNPLHLAVIAQAHFDTVRLPFPPAIVQRLGLALGSPLGHVLGYEAVYVPAPAPAGPPAATLA